MRDVANHGRVRQNLALDNGVPLRGSADRIANNFHGSCFILLVGIPLVHHTLEPLNSMLMLLPNVQACLCGCLSQASIPRLKLEVQRICTDC